MNRSLALVSLLCLAGETPAFAQRGAPVNSLARALATFTAADTNKDGKLTADEGSVLPIKKRDFDAQDHDKDGALSRDEFLIYYRQLLLDAREQAAPDLEAETARIQALRKVKETEEAKKRAAAAATQKANPETNATTAEDQRRRVQTAPQVTSPGQTKPAAGRTVEPSGPPAATPPAPAPVAPFAAPSQAPKDDARLGEPNTSEPPASPYERRLLAALEDLERRASQRLASKEDFQRIREIFIAHARAGAKAAGQTDPQVDEELAKSETYQKLVQALETLEKETLSGAYSRERYQALRDQMIHRARMIESGRADAANTPAAAPAPHVGPYYVRLQHALEDLERRASQRLASKEDFQRIRELFIAHARAGAKAAGKTDADGDVENSAAYQRLGQELDRLEKKAAETAFTKEEFKTLEEIALPAVDAPSPEARGPSDARLRAAEEKTKAASTQNTPDGKANPSEPSAPGSRRRSNAAEGTTDKPAPSPAEKPAEKPKEQRPIPPPQDKTQGATEKDKETPKPPRRAAD